MKKGFTLIELLVVLAIFTVMTGVVLANYPDFNTKISRDVLVQSVALSIREAQVSGTSIRSDSILDFTAGEVANAYGMYFGGTKSYSFFTDRNGDSLFDPNDVKSSELITTYSITTGKNSILYTCGNYYYTNSAGVLVPRNDPLTDCATYPLEELNVVFHRPNPEAVIVGKLKDGAQSYCGNSPDTGELVENAADNKTCRYSNAAIFIGDGVNNPPKKVIIWNTGQIATE